MNELSKIQQFLGLQFRIYVPGRILLRQGYVWCRWQGWSPRNKLYVLFLFSDILLWTNTKGKFQWATQLRNCLLKPSDSKSQAEKKFQVIFHDKAGKNLIVQCSSESLREAWFADILKAIRTAYNESSSGCNAKSISYSYQGTGFKKFEEIIGNECVGKGKQITPFEFQTVPKSRGSSIVIKRKRNESNHTNSSQQVHDCLESSDSQVSHDAFTTDSASELTILDHHQSRSETSQRSNTTGVKVYQLGVDDSASYVIRRASITMKFNDLNTELGKQGNPKHRSNISQQYVRRADDFQISFRDNSAPAGGRISRHGSHNDIRVEEQRSFPNSRRASFSVRLVSLANV